MEEQRLVSFITRNSNPKLPSVEVGIVTVIGEVGRLVVSTFAKLAIAGLVLTNVYFVGFPLPTVYGNRKLVASVSTESTDPNNKTGNAFTVTVVLVDVDVHPFASVVVTLYVVVALGLNVTEAVFAPVLQL